MPVRNTLLLSTVALSLMLIIEDGQAQALALRINQAASQALQPEHLVIQQRRVLLYGVQTNTADTLHGKYACAKVVSVTLRQAGVKIPVTLAVAGIETHLKHWQRIRHAEQLKPGDVVVWISRFKGHPHGACTGGGSCHVGIVSDRGFFHNNPLGNRPIFNGIGLSLGYRFKAAYRPPAESR